MDMEKKKGIWNKDIFWGTFLSVIIVHGTMLFNKIAWHDAAASIYYGWLDGIIHGRWFYQIISEVFVRIAGVEEAPVVHGIIIGLCIAGMVCLLYELFDIKDKALRFSLIPIFVAIPAVIGNLGYIGSSGQNFIGLFVCVLAAYVLCRGICNHKNVLTYLLAAFLCACAIGEYQCYLSYYLSILLLYFTQNIIKEKTSWKDYFLKAFYYVGSAILGLIMYLFINEYYLTTRGAALTSYAGTDTYGIVGIEQYIGRVIFAYSDFLGGGNYAPYSMFPFHWGGAYKLLLLTILFLAVGVVVMKLMQRNYSGVIQFGIVFCLLPLGMNFNFILYDSVHSLHMYHYVLLFVYLAILVREVRDFITSTFDENKKIIHGITRFVCGAVAGLILLFGALYIRYDNSCYMAVQMRHDATVSYFTTLVTRIQSIEGYSPELPVVYINDTQKANTIDTIRNIYDYPITNPYNYPMVNSYTWRSIMANWCDYAPAELPADLYKDNPTVLEMPSYPSDGSIQIIDGVIVIKF